MERLWLSNIRFAYPDSDWSLEVPSFRLCAGEIAAIVGLNGSGKSTFLRIAAGALRPDAGEAVMDGKDIFSLDRRSAARLVGYLPQNTTCEYDLHVIDIVAMGRYPHLKAGGFLNEADLEVVEESMRLTETLAFRKRRLSQLSGGEQKRVFLASVLAQEPSLLLLDEPTASLDLHHQALFFELLRDLADKGLGVLAAIHDVNAASLYCSRMALFENGRIGKEGTPEKVLTPETVSRTYGEGVLLTRHPQGRPMLFPQRRGEGR